MKYAWRTKKLSPTEDVKRMYYDSLVFTPALRHLVAEVGADHHVMETDYRFPWVSAPVDHVMNMATLSDVQKDAILGATAARLLNLRFCTRALRFGAGHEDDVTIESRR